MVGGAEVTRKTVPLTCLGCGMEWEHVMCGVEPQGTVSIESDTCAACWTPGDGNAVASYYDEDDAIIKVEEFMGEK